MPPWHNRVHFYLILLVYFYQFTGIYECEPRFVATDMETQDINILHSHCMTSDYVPLDSSPLPSSPLPLCNTASFLVHHREVKQGLG